MKAHYKTLATETDFLLKDKGSKFIAYAKSCGSDAEIRDFLENLKKLHPQATHICYAYKLGVNQEKYRANDDGEPNNSAGIPILGQLNSFEITNAIVAVARYYGGTKLGVGGLISAYKNAAKGALELNEIIMKELTSSLGISSNYEDFPLLMNFLKQNNVNIVQQNQGEKVVLTLEIPNSILDRIKNHFLNFKSLEIVNEIKNI